MKKTALIALFLTIVLASLHNHALAEETPAAKFVGKTLANPNRPVADTNAETSGQSKAAAKYISSGNDVGFYDVWFEFQRDNDGDGFQQQFEVFFDIDSRYNNTRIYVTGQLNNGTTTPLFRTDAFTINGATGADTYSATVLLTEGYPSGQYSLTLKVYDAQTNALMLTYSPAQDMSLAQLYLEDAGRDVISNAQLQVFEFAFTLLNDYDGDGYYTDADVRLDIDAPQQTQTLYVSLFLVDEAGNWIPLKNSSTFTVSNYSANDKISLSFGLNSGFDPQRYQLLAEIHDAYTHTVLLTSITPKATPVKMESVDYDDSYYSVEVYYEDSHQGGSTSLWMLLAGLGMLIKRNRKQIFAKR